MDSTSVAALDAQIQNLLESLLELGICASEVHPSAVEASPEAPQGVNGNHEPHHLANPAGYDAPGGLVGRKVQDTVQAMSALFSSHLELPDLRGLLVPNEVVEFVDQGRNPDIYTRELVERVAGENMFTNGILDAVSSYQELLAKEMKEAFPAMTSAIDEMGMRANPSSPKLADSVKMEE